MHVCAMHRYPAHVSGLAGLQGDDCDVGERLCELHGSGQADVYLAALTIVEWKERSCEGHGPQWGFRLGLEDWVTLQGQPAEARLSWLYNYTAFLKVNLYLLPAASAVRHATLRMCPLNTLLVRRAPLS